MQTRMPFDTEKERKFIKRLSPRQAIYSLFATLIYVSIAFEIAFSGGRHFMVTIILLLLCLPLVSPLLILAFLTHKDTGYFYDKHLWFLYKNKKTQIGIWRK